MSNCSADIVIVGGGGVGSALAYFLTKITNRDLSVFVVEKDMTYEFASTTLAAGGVRQMFSTPENVQMSQFGFEFVQSAAQHLAIDDIEPDMGLKIESYLRLLSEDQRKTAEDQVEMQRSLGANPEWLEQGQLRDRFPWMNVEDVSFGILGGGGEGVFDPFALLQAFKKKAIMQGAKYIPGEVIGFDKEAAGKIAAVKLADGTSIQCGSVVNAAGPNAAAIAQMAGLDVPVVPMKSHTFSFRCADSIVDCPVVLDRVTHANFKAEGDLFLVAWGARNDQNDLRDFEVEYDLFDEEIWPTLAHRVPQFEAIKMQRAWVGYLEINTFDANPILGPHPKIDNFLFACGLSGHGVQHLPAVGRGMAELIVHGKFTTLNLARFGYHRLLKKAPVPETV